MKTLLLGLVFVGRLTCMAEENVVFLKDPTQPETLTCPLFLPGDASWSHSGSNLVNSSKYLIYGQNKTLTIMSVTSESDLGNYECKVMNIEKIVVLKSRPIITKPTKKSFNLIEGDTMVLECKAYAFPPPNSSSWEKINSPDFSQYSNQRISTSFADGAAKLTISGVQIDDDGSYFCSIKNGIGNGANVTFRVRINSKLAPLWPTIGILVEVLLVVIIIVVMEKKRSKVDSKEG